MRRIKEKILADSTRQTGGTGYVHCVPILVSVGWFHTFNKISIPRFDLASAGIGTMQEPVKQLGSWQWAYLSCPRTGIVYLRYTCLLYLCSTAMRHYALQVTVQEVNNFYPNLHLPRTPALGGDTKHVHEHIGHKPCPFVADNRLHIMTSLM